MEMSSVPNVVEYISDNSSEEEDKDKKEEEDEEDDKEKQKNSNDCNKEKSIHQKSNALLQEYKRTTESFKKEKRRFQEEYVLNEIVLDLFKKETPSVYKISLVEDIGVRIEIVSEEYSRTTLFKLSSEDFTNVKDLDDLDIQTELLVFYFINDYICGSNDFNQFLEILMKKEPTLTDDKRMILPKTIKRNLEQWLYNYIAAILHFNDTTFEKKSKKQKDAKKSKTGKYYEYITIMYNIECLVYNLFDKKQRFVVSQCIFFVTERYKTEKLFNGHFYIYEECSYEEGREKIKNIIINNLTSVNKNTKFCFCKNGWNDFPNALTPTIHTIFIINNKSTCEVDVKYNHTSKNIGEFKFKKDLGKELRAFVREKLNIPDDWRILLKSYIQEDTNFLN